MKLKALQESLEMVRRRNPAVHLPVVDAETIARRRKVNANRLRGKLAGRELYRKGLVMLFYDERKT